MRQWIEAIVDQFKDQLSLERHGAHTMEGLPRGLPSDCWPWARSSGTTGSFGEAGVLEGPLRSVVAYDH